MNEIFKLKDLKELVNQLSNFDDNTVLVFSDRFNDYAISKSFSYDISENAITINCEKIGSVLKGTHRVLGKGKE